MGRMGDGRQAVGQGHRAGDDALHGGRDAAGRHAHHARGGTCWGKRRRVSPGGAPSSPAPLHTAETQDDAPSTTLKAAGRSGAHAPAAHGQGAQSPACL